MPNDKATKVYSLLNKAGLQGLPSEEEFVEQISSDKDKALKAYGLLVKSGLQGLPDEETFWSQVSGGEVKKKRTFYRRFCYSFGSYIERWGRRIKERC